MRVFFAIIVVFGALFGAFSFAPNAYANSIEECQCWCAFSGGADKGPVTTIDKPGTCTEYCRDSGGRSLGCFVKGAPNTPDNNTRCWTQDECTESTSTINGREVNGEWGTKQPDECIAGEHFCYNPALPITLGVPVDGIGEVRGLMEYIQIMYAFLIRVGALISVVIMMAGGFMWMTSRGGPAIGKAKSMIAKAATGLVLLLSAVAIATIIDPRLNNFEELRVPKVQQSIFLSEDSSCEQIAAQGIKVEQQRGTLCGDEGKITEIPSGIRLTNGLEVGSTCQYIRCEDETDRCIEDKATSEYTCVSCSEISPASDNGIPVTPSTCSSFATNEITGPGYYRQECIYTQDSDAVELSFVDVDVAGIDEFASTGTCAELTIDCQDNVNPLGYSCADYNLVPVESSGDTAWLIELDTGSNRPLESICNQDPCGVGPCNYVETVTGAHYCESTFEAFNDVVGRRIDSIYDGFLELF